MAEAATAAGACSTGAPRPDWVADVLTRELGLPVRVRQLERRAEFDVFGAEAAVGRLLVKVGQAARLAREAGNLRRAAAVVGNLVPALVCLAAPVDGPGVLAMTYVSGARAAPGRLSTAAWGQLTRGLLRLHAQPAGNERVCIPLAPDFITLGPTEDRRVSLPDLRSILAQAAGDTTVSDAPRLLDALLADVLANPSTFELLPRLVHADIWPENVLVSGRRCYLIDWAWLKASDYALDLAHLKLLLDWAWPAWLAQVAFERLLRRYVDAFGDTGLPARMALYMPLVSLVHLIQYAEGGKQDAYNAAAMRACLTSARRDRAVWAHPSPTQRLLHTLIRPCQSEYGDRAEARQPRRFRRGGGSR